MANGFNLTAQLNLRGPTNVRPILSRLRRQLGNISANVNVGIDPASARNVAALQASLTGLNRTLPQTSRLANDAAAAINNLSTAATRLGANIGNLPNNIGNATRALNNAARTTVTTNRNVRQAAQGFEEFGRQAGLAVRRFAAFATVTSVIYKFSNALSSASKEFIDFNRELVRVAQVTDSSLKNLGPLVSQISFLSTSLGVASKDLISVSSTLAQAGLSARDTERALKALALSALAPSFDNLNDTVEGSIALMRQFGIGAEGLESALGSVNAVAAAFAVEASDLIVAIQRTGGVFANASKGVSEGKDSLNEFLAVFTSIRQTTRESAETIATGLRTIFTRIQRGKTIDALKEYGVVLTDLTGKFVGPYEAVRRLSEGLSRLDPRDLRFSEIVEELGGFRQIGKVIPLIQQFAVAQQALKVAQQGQGSLADDAATAQLSLANRLTKVREEFNALIRSIGESSSFQTFVTLSLDLASALIKLADSAKNVLPALTAIAAFRGVAALSSFSRGFASSLRPGPVARPNSGGYIRKFAKGGIVPGSGKGDKILAWLEPGEVVMSNVAASKYGRKNLEAMNRGGTISRFKKGGPVPVSRLLDRSGGPSIQKAIDTTNLELNDTVSANIIPREVPLTDQDFYNIWLRAKRSAKQGKGRFEHYAGVDVSRQNRGRLKELSGKNKEQQLQIRRGYGKDISKKVSMLQSAEGRWGTAYEDFLVNKLKGNWTKASKSSNYPVDLLQKLSNNSVKRIGEAKFRTTPTENIDLISKLLRYRIETGSINRYFKENKKVPRDLDKNVGSLDYFWAGNYKEQFYKFIENRQKIQAPGFALGGSVQRFAKGGEFYHGSGDAIDKVDPEKLGSRGVNMLGAGFNVAPSLETARAYEDMARRKHKREHGTTRGFAGGTYPVSIRGGIDSFPEAHGILSGKTLQSMRKVYKQARISDIGLDWKTATFRFALDHATEQLSDRIEPKLRKKKNIKDPRYEAIRIASQQVRQLMVANGISGAKNIAGRDLKDQMAVVYDPDIVKIGKPLKRKFLGGELIQNFADAGDVEQDLSLLAPYGQIGILASKKIQADKKLTIQDAVKKTLVEQLVALGGESGVNSLEPVPGFLKRRLRKNLIEDGSVRSLDAAKIINKALNNKGVADAKEEKRIQGLTKVAVAGLLPIGYSDNLEWTLPSGKVVYAYIRGLSSRYTKAIAKMQQKTSAAANEFAEDLQYAEIFGGDDSLVFDFDDTVVAGADILDATGKPDISKYGNKRAVTKALNAPTTRLTRLGNKLRMLLAADPSFINKTRILTARPQQTAGLLAAKLRRLGLPYSPIPGVPGGITGVGGPGANIPLAKAKNLAKNEKLIDDSLANIQAVRKSKKKAFEYQEPKRIPELDEIMGQGNIEGAVIEKALAELGANLPPIATLEANRSVDFPIGLGKSAQFFNIDPTIPTEVKRTLNGSSFAKARKEFDRFYTEKQETPKRFNIGGLVPGVGNTDSVPMKLTPRSFVIRKGSVKKLGANNLAAMAGYASGGDVPSVDALVTPGEWIFSPDQAQKIGSATLHRMNKFGKFAKGGNVGPQRFAVGGSADPSLNREVYRLAKQLVKNGQSMSDALVEARGRVEKAYGPASPALGTKPTKTSSGLAYGVKTPSGSTIPLSQLQNQGITATRDKADIQADRLARRKQDSENRRKQTMARGFKEYEESLTFSGKAKTFEARATSYRSQAKGQEGFSALGSNIKADMSAGMASLNRGLASGAATLSKFTTGAGQAMSSVVGFGRQLRSNPLSVLTKAAGNAANSLYGLGKRATGAVGGMFGFGRGRGAAAGAAGAARAATADMGGMGGMGGGMMAMMLPMVGGMAVEQLSKSMGGETTDAGRMVSSIGSQALNYGSMGAMIGSVIPGVGTALGGLIGAAAGATIGLFEAEKAGKEYAESQRQEAANMAMEKSGKAVDKFAQSGKTADRSAAIKALAEASSAEAAAGAGIERKSGESITDFAERRRKTQTAGAEQAEKILVTSMMKSGKTFDEMSKSMNPAEFQMLANNIAEADKTYAYFQTQRASEIARLKKEGRGAEAAALEAKTPEEEAKLAKEIAARKMKEHDAAVAAQKAAAASKALAMTVNIAIMSLERTFDIMNQTMQRAAFEFEEAGNNIQEIVSGQSRMMAGQGLQKQINVLENPDAYSAAERNTALSRSASMLGSKGAMTARISQFGPEARDAALRIANQGAATNATNEEIGDDIKKTLRRQITAAYGADTDIGRNAIKQMEDNIDKALKDSVEGEPIDFNAIVDSAVGPLMKASEQASKTLIEANKMAASALKYLAETAEAVADLQQKQVERTNALREMQRESSLKTREALGISVSGRDRIRSRMAGTAQRLGFRRPEDVNAANIAAARQKAVRDQNMLLSQKPAMEALESRAAAGDRAAAQALTDFNIRLRKANQTVKDLDKELGDLPQLLESNLNDVLSEIQERVNDLEQRKEAGASFAEKLVGSTPEEMIALNRTFALLQNTLRGNIITINRSQSAQMAYFTALQQGKTVQEAMADAQRTFADENKAALGLFNELMQISGVKGQAFDSMRADLLENFARSQGMGLQNNPMFRQVIAELRKTPEQRAQQDPALRALLDGAEAIKREQVAAVAQQNRIDQQAQKQLLDNASNGIIAKLQQLQFKLQANLNAGAVIVGAQLLNAGGMVYAANGKLINYEPRGTDTVPAMLTPGEFVVNRSATQKNLPLLQAINSGHMSKGGVVYLAEGGGLGNDLSGTTARSAAAFTRENTQRQNSALKVLDSNVNDLKFTTNDINRDTTNIRSDEIPGLYEENSQSMAMNANSFSSLGKALAKLSQELSPAKKPLSDFYDKFDTFSDSSSATLASISDNSDLITAAAIKISDDIANMINVLNPAAGAVGLGQMLGNMFGNVNFGQIISNALSDALRNVGPALGFSSGGVVYANNGMLIPYQPRGTDTVPAMLTPGEFVINRAATQKNLPLLKAINNGSARYNKGGVVYAQDGGSAAQEKAVATQAKTVATKAPNASQDYMFSMIGPRKWVDSSGKYETVGTLQEILAEVGTIKGAQDIRILKTNGKTTKINQTKLSRADISYLDNLQPMREWYSDTREYKTQARLLNVTPKEITIQKPDQSIKNVPMDRLSLEDRYHLMMTYPNVFPKSKPMPEAPLPDGPDLSKATTLDDVLGPIPTDSEPMPNAIWSKYKAIEEAYGITQGPKIIDQSTISFRNQYNDIIKQLDDIVANKRRSGFPGRVGPLTNLATPWSPEEMQQLSLIKKSINSFIQDPKLPHTEEFVKKIETLSDAFIKTKELPQTQYEANLRSNAERMIERAKQQEQFDRKYTLDPMQEGFVVGFANPLRPFGNIDFVPRTKELTDGKTNLLYLKRIQKETFDAARNLAVAIGLEQPFDAVVDFKRRGWQEWVRREMEETRQRIKPDPRYNKYETGLPRNYNTGGVVYANNGMLIPYQPRGTDTVPAMLTPGEFVVNRSATQKHLPLLKSINNGADVQYRAQGGAINARESQLLSGFAAENTRRYEAGITPDTWVLVDKKIQNDPKLPTLTFVDDNFRRLEGEKYVRNAQGELSQSPFFRIKEALKVVAPNVAFAAKQIDQFAENKNFRKWRKYYKLLNGNQVMQAANSQYYKKMTPADKVIEEAINQMGIPRIFQFEGNPAGGHSEQRHRTAIGRAKSLDEKLQADPDKFDFLSLNVGKRFFGLKQAITNIDDGLSILSKSNPRIYDDNHRFVSHRDSVQLWLNEQKNKANSEINFISDVWRSLDRGPMQRPGAIDLANYPSREQTYTPFKYAKGGVVYAKEGKRIGADARIKDRQRKRGPAPLEPSGDALKAFGVGALKGTGPTAAGITATSSTFSVLSPLIPASGPFAPAAALGVGALSLGAGVIGAMATSMAQENYLDALAPATNAEMKRLVEENPAAATLGGAVPGVGVGLAQQGLRSFVGTMSQRLGSGAAGAGIGAGIEYGTTGKIDPTNLGVNFGVGFAQPMGGVADKNTLGNLTTDRGPRKINTGTGLGNLTTGNGPRKVNTGTGFGNLTTNQGVGPARAGTGLGGGVTDAGLPKNQNISAGDQLTLAGISEVSEFFGITPDIPKPMLIRLADRIKQLFIKKKSNEDLWKVPNFLAKKPESLLERILQDIATDADSVSRTAASLLASKQADPKSLKVLENTLKNSGVDINALSKLGGGMESVVLDSGSQVLKIGLTKNDEVSRALGSPDLERFVLPEGIPGVVGYTDKFTEGPYSAGLQPKTKVLDEAAQKEFRSRYIAGEIIKWFREQGYAIKDVHEGNVGYARDPNSGIPTSMGMLELFDGVIEPIRRKMGGIVYANNGMLVSYQPKGTDTVPAMLTPGEFVVNRSATQRNLPLLQAINSGYHSSGGKISYLAEGTPGVEAFNKQMMLLTEILKISADNLKISFETIVDRLKNINISSPEQLISTGGVSNTSNPLAAIQALGTKLDQFIVQLQQSIPPSITLEVPQPIPVNVNINGSAALQNLLSGPLSTMIQTIITNAFNEQSRKREGQ